MVLVITRQSRSVEGGVAHLKRDTQDRIDRPCGRSRHGATRYNQERTHQALAMNVPAELYTRSARVYRGLEDVALPVSRRDVHRDALRRDLLPWPQINLSRVFAGQNVGVPQVGDDVWLVTFMH